MGTKLLRSAKTTSCEMAPSGMAMPTGAYGMSQMMKEGSKHLSGLEAATLKNIDACKQLTNTVRTSLGPNGMNKMVINHLEKLFVTNDSATIMKELEVQHPAAKLLVMASKMQEQDVGDGTNFVVVLAGELLHQAEDLLRMGLHQSEIIIGYTKAMQECNKIMERLVVHAIDSFRDEAQVAKAINAVIASKQYGVEGIICPMIAKACVQVMPENPKGFNVDNVRVAKILGGHISKSTVVSGMVVTRGVHGAVKHVTNAKVAVVGCEFDSSAPETKGTVLITNAEQLLNYNKSEEDWMQKVVQGYVDQGVKVVVCGQTIGEMAQHFLDRAGILTIKIGSKFELRRVCRTVGASTVIRLTDPPTIEQLGFCDSAGEEEIGSTKCTVFRRDAEGCKVATLVVRGSTQNILDDLERAIDDGVNVVKAMGKDTRFLGGAGATEIHLAHTLSQFADQQSGLDQYAVKKFAEAFEIIPRTLAENSGQDATSLISSLYSAHAGATNPDESVIGVNVEGGGTCNVVEKGIFDLYLTKLNAIKLAVDAAVTVLRVDQIIMSKPAGGPKAPAQGGGDDD